MTDISNKFALFSRRALWEFGLILLGMAASCYFFYPGCTSGDPSFSWLESIHRPPGNYTNWHPPMVAYTWHLLNQIPIEFTPQSANLFVALNLLYWTGLILVIRPWFSRKILWLAFFLYVGFFPPAFGILSQTIKDSLMCASMLAAYGGLLEAERRRSKFWFMFGVFCLFLALSYRHNAVFAVLPLAFWAGYIACRHLKQPSWWKNAAAGLAIFVALVGSSIAADNALITRSSYPIQQIYAYDLLGISAITGNVYLPSFYNENKPGIIWRTKNVDQPGLTTSMDNIQQIFSPYGNMDMYWYGDGKGLRFLGDKQEVDELQRDWLSTLFKEPWAYLELHKTFFLSLIGIKPYREIDWPYFCMSHNLSNPTEIAMPAFYLTLSGTLFFKGFFYMGAIAGLLALCAWKRKTFPAHLLVLGSSALIYAASYFVLSTDSSFRYLYWLIPVCVIMFISMAFRLLTMNRRQ